MLQILSAFHCNLYNSVSLLLSIFSVKNLLDACVVMGSKLTKFSVYRNFIFTLPEATDQTLEFLTFVHSSKLRHFLLSIQKVLMLSFS